MAQDLTVNIKTTSDVPQAMDKAKTATTGFSKQVEDIGRKFGTSFKDIFLSFLGPMALLTGAMALIGKMIADNEKKRAEANQAAIDGTNELMSAEDKYWARKNERENKTKQTAEQAKIARKDVTLSFLQTDPRGKGMVEDILSKLPPGMRASASFNTANTMSKQKDVQDKVQAMIAEDVKNNPEAAATTLEKAKDTAFKGPEGFSNVVGVGANPVMEAMSKQLEEQQKQTALLEQIANKGGSGGVPAPFTESRQFPGYGEQM